MSTDYTHHQRVRHNQVQWRIRTILPQVYWSLSRVKRSLLQVNMYFFAGQSASFAGQLVSFASQLVSFASQ